MLFEKFVKTELTRGHYQVVIYYELQQGLTRQLCINELISKFGDEAPSFATVKRWFNEFNHAVVLRSTLREGRPKSVVLENIDAV